MTTISAETILRSRNTASPDKVLSTILCRYPRFIHAEVMTHRALSRNSASSRAIPTAKLIEDVRQNPAFPLHWGKNQSGMQAREELPWFQRLRAEHQWKKTYKTSLKRAQKIAEVGTHKQLANRLLEPFAHITVLISATEWDNFLELRDHEDAEPHIQMLAREIRKCLENDPVQDLEPGEWHLPFTAYDNRGQSDKLGDYIKLSMARCASTSYKTVDGFNMTLDRAAALHDKLVSSRPLHSSPAEHQAQADDVICGPVWKNPDEHGNFIGFRQYRKQLEKSI